MLFYYFSSFFTSFFTSSFTSSFTLQKMENVIKSWDLYSIVVYEVSGCPATNYCFDLWFMTEISYLYQTICLYFNKVTSGELFEIRFSYKHRNFSRVCILVKMVSKPVTRSISNPSNFSYRTLDLDRIPFLPRWPYKVQIESKG